MVVVVVAVFQSIVQLPGSSGVNRYVLSMFNGCICISCFCGLQLLGWPGIATNDM